MLNFVIGFLLGGCIAVCVLCCVQVNAVNRYEREIADLWNSSSILKNVITKIKTKRPFCVYGTPCMENGPFVISAGPIDANTFGKGGTREFVI